MSKLLIISTFALSLSTSLSFADNALKLQENKMEEQARGSIITFTCPKCEKEVVDEGPVLARGSQIFEMRTVGEEEKLYRTENWLGGSPVSYAHVSPTPEATSIALGNKTPEQDTKIDDNPVASIGVTEPTRLAIYGPESSPEDMKTANAETIEVRPHLGPDIEPNLMPAVTASAAMNKTPVQNPEAEEMAKVEAPAPKKELDTASFSLRLN